MNVMEHLFHINNKSERTSLMAIPTICLNLVILKIKFYSIDVLGLAYDNLGIFSPNGLELVSLGLTQLSLSVFYQCSCNSCLNELHVPFEGNSPTNSKLRH